VEDIDFLVDFVAGFKKKKLKIWVWREKSVEPSMCSHWVQGHGATLVYIRFISNSTRGVSHHGLAIYIKKSILRRKKKYENSNISPCKNIIFKKIQKSFKKIS
jgi:hypothetical protein